MHEDGALIHLAFDANVSIGSRFKQYKIAFVEGGKHSNCDFCRLLLTARVESVSSGIRSDEIV